MSDQEFDVAAFAAESTGTAGISDDAGLDQVVPDALANDVEDYDRQTEHRDAHLTQDDTELDDQEGQQPAKSVPLGALQEERNLRKQLQTELEAHRHQVQQLQAYQQQVQAFLAQQQQAQIPNFEDDPQGHVEAVKQQFANELGQMRQQMELQRFGQQLESDVAAVAPTVIASEEALREEVGGETYDAAYQHVHAHVQQELAQRYPGANPAMLAQLEQVAGVAFVQQCRQQGIDPARHIFEKAQALGFNPGQRVPSQPRRSPPTSLSTIPAAGRAPDQRGKLTAKDIASMPQEDFDKLFESMRDTQRPQF